MKTLKSKLQSSMMTGVGMLGLVMPQVATAQDGPPGSQQMREGSGLREIVVTAQRREERLQDVPISVSAITSEKLEASGVEGALQLAEVIPGLSFTQSAGFTQVRIRGIGTSSFGPGIENPVATYIDGVYVATTAGSLYSLSNIERVEVLKGPQGTLFGRNATGGLVQIVTAEPSQTFMGNAKLSYGNYDTAGVDLYATGGLSDDVSASLVVHYENQGDGYGTNIVTGNDAQRQNHNLGVRSKLKFEPTDTLKFVLAGDYTYAKGSLAGSIQQKAGIENIGTFEKLFTNRLDGDPTNDLPLIDHGGFYDISYTQDPLTVDEGFGVSFDASLDIGDINIQSITAYRQLTHELRFDLDVLPQDVFSFDGAYKYSQFSQELKLSGETGALGYTAGLYYFHSSDEYDPYFVIFGPQGTFLISGAFDRIENTILSNPKANSYAAYAQGTYSITPTTNLTLGGRYTYERRSNDGIRQIIGFVDGAAVPLVPPGTPLYPPDFDNEVSYDNFSYRIALDQKLAQDIMVYASMSTAFKSGGFNSAVPANPAFLPEKLEAYEIGLKTQFLNNAVRFNVAAFLYDYKNIQINNFQGTTLFITNGPKARIKGVEAELDVSPTNGLVINASAAYTHDRFTEFPLADYNYVVPGCIYTNPSTSRVCQADAAGNKLPGTPTFTGSVGLSYEHDLGNGSAGFSANLFHSSGFYGTTDNDPRIRQDSYQVLNASIFFKISEMGPRFTLWARNLLDEQYARSALINSGSVQYTAQPPRTWGVSIGQEF